MKIGYENRGVGEIKKQCAKFGISPIELSIHIQLVPVRIYEILKGKRKITVDTDLRLCRFFGFEPGHFFALQTEYDFAVATGKLKDRLARIIPAEKAVLKGKPG